MTHTEGILTCDYNCKIQYINKYKRNGSSQFYYITITHYYNLLHVSTTIREKINTRGYKIFAYIVINTLRLAAI
jgi:hypothetical protein